MAALLGIFMLIERGPIEAAQAVRIVGKVSWHPVQNDGEVLSMACVDQRSKIGGSAKTTGRREQPSRLISPGPIEGMLADGQKFDVRESHLMRVGRQLLSQLAIAQPAAAVLRMPPPRSEMDFIDRYRRAQGIDAAWRRLRPSDHVLIDHDRRRLRAQLGGECQRIGLERQ